MNNNKLIAEFMGVPQGKHTHFMVEPFALESYADVDDLKYDASWDWLIPVIEKIEGAGLDPHGMIDNSLRKNNQKRWRSIEDLYNVAVYLIKIHNNGQRQNNQRPS